MNTGIASYFDEYIWAKSGRYSLAKTQPACNRILDITVDGMSSGAQICRGDGEYVLLAPDRLFGKLRVHEEAYTPWQITRINQLSDRLVVREALKLARRTIAQPERVIAALAFVFKDAEAVRTFVADRRVPSSFIDTVGRFAMGQDMTVSAHGWATLYAGFSRAQPA